MQMGIGITMNSAKVESTFARIILDCSGYPGCRKIGFALNSGICLCMVHGFAASKSYDCQETKGQQCWPLRWRCRNR